MAHKRIMLPCRPLWDSLSLTAIIRLPLEHNCGLVLELARLSLRTTKAQTNSLRVVSTTNERMLHKSRSASEYFMGWHNLVDKLLFIISYIKYQYYVNSLTKCTAYLGIKNRRCCFEGRQKHSTNILLL